MAHMIEDNNMFSVAITPWHGLGIVLEAPPTSAEAIIAAGMDWGVDKRQLYYGMPSGDVEQAGGLDFRQAEGRFGLFRETDNKLFGVVTSDYEVVQNRDSFEFFDPLIRDGLATYETAGVLTDGRVWVLARIAGDMIVADDEIRKYVLMLNDHSGGGSVILNPTGVRAVCNNTIMQSLATGLVFKHAHRKGVMERLNITKEDILALVSSFAGLETDLARFTEVRMSSEELERYFNAVAELDMSATDSDQDEKVDRAVSNRMKAAHVMQDMHQSGKGASDTTRGTLYGAYNAAIEFVDWRMGARAKDRARYQLFGPGACMRKRAYDLALQLV